MINLDFSGVKTREPLEEGIYTVTIDEAEETVSKSSGNPMIRVRYAVEGYDNKLFDNFVLTEKALWKLKELLDALDYDTSDVVDLDVQELVGAVLQAKVIQEEYEGNIVNRVVKLFPSA